MAPRPRSRHSLCLEHPSNQEGLRALGARLGADAAPSARGPLWLGPCPGTSEIVPRPSLQCKALG
eukprot:3584988-Alexandrium_andersonii.AAC.1